MTFSGYQRLATKCALVHKCFSGLCLHHVCQYSRDQNKQHGQAQIQRIKQQNHVANGHAHRIRGILYEHFVIHHTQQMNSNWDIFYLPMKVWWLFFFHCVLCKVPVKISPLIFVIGNKPLSKDLNANLCKIYLTMFNVLLVWWSRTLGCSSSWIAFSSDWRLRGVLKTWDSHQRTGAGCRLLQVWGRCDDQQSYSMCWTRIILCPC